jgi:hypothetical protein
MELLPSDYKSGFGGGCTDQIDHYLAICQAATAPIIRDL